MSSSKLESIILTNTIIIQIITITAKDYKFSKIGRLNIKLYMCFHTLKLH